MDILLFICMKEQQTVNILYGLRINQVPKCIEGCQYRVKIVSTNGLKCSKMVAKVLSIKEEPEQQLKETVYTWFVSSQNFLF